MATVAQIDWMREGALAGIPLPATLRPAAPMTDAEILAFSRRNRPYRIERNKYGELEIMTPVNSRGSRWEAFVIRELDFWAEENGGVSFSSNGGFTLADGSMLSPDAAWASSEAWNSLTAEQQDSFAPICPEFIVEIRSKSDSIAVLQAKMEAWMANGAQLAWMIDPYAATISIYRSGQAVEVLERPDSVKADGPVAGFRLTTARLWAV